MVASNRFFTNRLQAFGYKHKLSAGSVICLVSSDFPKVADGSSELFCGHFLYKVDMYY